MRSNMWKRMIALACAGIMVVGGSSWSTVSVKAAEEAPSLEALSVEEAPALEAVEVEEVQETYAAQANMERVVGTPNPRWFNKDYSTSYYTKVAIKSATADSIATNEGSINAVFDNNVESYWHSDYSGKNDVTGAPGAITGKNTVTLTLSKPENINGITHTPRPSKANGIIREFKVEVHISGTPDTQWVAPTRQNGNNMYFAAIGSGNYQKGIDEEFLFGKTIENVDKVKFIITQAYSTTDKAFISAGELGVIKDDKTVAVKEEKAKLKAAIDKLTAEKKLYDDTAAVEAFIADAQAVYDKKEATIDEIKQKTNQLKEAKFLFNDKTIGKGYYVSDTYREKKAEAGPSWEETIADRNCKNLPIKIDKDNPDATFLKGIGTHADDIIVFDIRNKGYKLFTSYVGVSQGQGGIVNFKVLTSKADDKTEDYNKGVSVLEENVSYEGGKRFIQVDLTGVNYVKLIVESGKDFNNDHANWADAKWYTELNPDVKALTATIEEAQKVLDQAGDRYSDESKQVLTNAIANAQNVKSDLNKSQEEIDAETKKLEDAITTFKSEYLYIITSNVNGKQTVQKQVYNKEVTVTADEANFLAWTDENNNIVSKESTYTYYVMGDTTLTAVYGEASVEEKTNIRVTNHFITPSVTKPGRYDVKFVIQAFVTENDKKDFTSMGAIWGPSSTNTRPYKAPKCNQQYQFSFTIKGVPAEATIFMNPYINIGSKQIVEKAEGNTYPVSK